MPAASNGGAWRGRDSRGLASSSTLGWTALVMMVAGSIVGLFIVPADGAQGEVSRILYVHVPSLWLAFFAFFVVFVMSVLYLIQRKLRWDLVGASAAEIGVIFTAVGLGGGILWAFPTWGTGWNWDPRVTTTALLLIIYVGYLMIRGFADDPDMRARWGSVVGIVGFAQVPIVYLSVYLWGSLHQAPSSPRSMDWRIGTVLLFNVVAFTVAFAWLLARRYRIAVGELELELMGPDDD